MAGAVLVSTFSVQPWADAGNLEEPGEGGAPPHRQPIPLRSIDCQCGASLPRVDFYRRTFTPPDVGKIERRIGRWLGRNPAAARLLDVVVVKDAHQRATGLQLSCPVEKGAKSDLSKGAYLLRTNCTETDPAKLWRWYMQLTQAEAAFRTAKSDIGLRPVYHRKTDRVEAHLLVCFLSLALWRSLEMWMLGKGLGSNARKLVNAFGTIKSMDVVVAVRRGDMEVKVRLRTVAKPDEDVAVLLSHLGLRLPSRSKAVQNVVEKNG